MPLTNKDPEWNHRLYNHVRHYISLLAITAAVMQVYEPCVCVWVCARTCTVWVSVNTHCVYLCVYSVCARNQRWHFYSVTLYRFPIHWWKVSSPLNIDIITVTLKRSRDGDGGTLGPSCVAGSRFTDSSTEHHWWIIKGIMSLKLYLMTIMIARDTHRLLTAYNTFSPLLNHLILRCVFSWKSSAHN